MSILFQADKYLEFHVFISPVHKLLIKNIESYEKRGLSKRQVEDEIVSDFFLFLGYNFSIIKCF